MARYVIIAICGKSATGKTTLARKLVEDAGDYPVNLIVSDTTRPPRDGEEDGVAYHFLGDMPQDKSGYLEWATFKGWFYGTPKCALKEDAINIGVFNAAGMRSLTRLYNNADDFEIIPIWLDLSLVTRLARMTERDGVRRETLRRVVADWHDFKGFSDTFNRFYWADFPKLKVDNFNTSFYLNKAHTILTKLNHRSDG